MIAKDLKHIIRFEHEKLLFDMQIEQERKLYEALEAYHGDYTPFFTLIRNGVQFCAYVGVLQVGDTIIEILPKADKSTDASVWQNILINMIRSVWGFSVKESGSSNLKLKHNSVLDLHFELFITELESLIHSGLIRKYARQEYNAKALKGKLSFAKHIQQNIIHKERFYIEKTVYTVQHQLHQIIYEALLLIQRLNRHALLASHIGNLLLNFPEQKRIKVNRKTFDTISYDRKSQVYRSIIDIAELILLNYHPDISKGCRHILALMFDMNALWEQFVLGLLRKSLKDYKVSGQISKRFWRGDSLSSSMRPDIVLTNKDSTIVIDTKWKNLKGKSPSPDDLRQMFVYHEYFEASKVILLYPGDDNLIQGQFYLKDQSGFDNKHCHVLQITTEKNFKQWKEIVIEKISDLL
ncbi:McrC family protein [Sphingobacterium sp. NPDC055346]